MPPPSAFLSPLVTPSRGSVSAVAILLPGDVAFHCQAEGLRILVGTVNGTPLRRTVREIGAGQMGLSVGKGFLSDIRAVLGDLVEVELDYNADPDAVEVPAELSALLDARPAVRKAFEALSVFDRRGLCMRVERAATPDVRTQRAERAVEGLGVAST